MRAYNKFILFDYIVKFILFSCAFLILLIYTNSYLSLKLNSYLKLGAGYFIKQGWSFFTKNPREAILHIYKIENDTIIVDKTNSNFNFEMFYGCNRLQRKIGGEYYYILNKLDTIGACILKRKDFNYIKIKEIKKEQLFKKDDYTKTIPSGYYLLCLTEVIPFTYYKYMDFTKTDYKILKVFVY